MTNPNCMTNRQKTLQEIYAEHERQKMVSYNDRVLQVEKGTFVPLVYTTSGGMSPQCHTVHKKIAKLLPTEETRNIAMLLNILGQQ